ncbi:MAG: hypothetical protein O3A00_03720 [Planctomycetota bacterium]|nr:hypothetical protein [Planctomycetota bacterium]
MPKISLQAASEADTEVTLLIFHDDCARSVLVDSEVNVSINRAPFSLGLIRSRTFNRRNPLGTEVQIANSRGHAVHWEVAGFRERMGKAGLQ